MSWFMSPDGQKASSMVSVFTVPEAELFDVPELVVCVGEDEDVEEEEDADDVEGTDAEEVVETVDKEELEDGDDFWVNKTPATATTTIMMMTITAAMILLMALWLENSRISSKSTMTLI